MCILHTLAAYHSCIACIVCTLLLEHHPLVHGGYGSDVDWVSHTILGNEMYMHVYMCIAFVFTFLVAIVACSVRYQMH